MRNSAKVMFHQVNSGFLKGKTLKIPSLDTTRSTKNIVRESLFNSIRYELSDTVFIEGFGGSGIMAAEALSNGAKQAIAIEKDRAAFSVLQSNFKSIDEKLKPIFGDTFLVLKDVLKNTEDEVILYLDPPFDIRDGFVGIYDKLILLLKSMDLKKVKFIIFEHNSDVKIDENFTNFEKLKAKRFGNTTLSYFKSFNL